MAAPDSGLPEQLTIETPEQTALEFPLAGIGSRFLAIAYDTILQFLVSTVLFLILIPVGISSFAESLSGGMWVLAFWILAVFLLYFGYFAFFEIRWNGQTPGKRHYRLRVIQDSGRPLSAYQAIGRNLLRIVDQLPGFYGVGIVVSLLSPQNKRLGDYVAGTVVVREGDDSLRAAPDWTKSARVSAAVFHAARLTPEEHRLVETFLERRSFLDTPLRDQMARQIADRIGQTLGVPPEQRPGNEAFLEAVAVERRHSAGYSK